MTSKKKISIFLSHSSQDNSFARRLAADLSLAGAKVWIDEAEIQIGDSLIQKIEEGIINTDFLGVVLSPNSVESSWVKREVEIALTKEINGNKVTVLPLLYQDCKIPPFLSGKLYADFRTKTGYSEALNKLKKSLGLRLTKEKLDISEAEKLSFRIFEHEIGQYLAGLSWVVSRMSESHNQLDSIKQKQYLQDIDFGLEEVSFQLTRFFLMRSFLDGSYALILHNIPNFTSFLREVYRPFVNQKNLKNLEILFLDSGINNGSRSNNDSITCDSDLVTICLRNLLQKAIEYSARDQKVEIAHSWHGTSTFTEITISFYAPSVSDAHIDTIFDKDPRSKSPLPTDWTGLYLAKLIARAHGGDVNYHRGQDETKIFFVLTLPKDLNA